MLELGLLNTIALISIIVLGIPHGGLDAAISRKKGWSKTKIHTVYFHVFYLSLTSLIIVLWYFFPLISLILFLTISALHFSYSDLNNSKDIRIDALISHGGIVPIIISYFQADLVLEFFSILSGQENAAIVITIINYLIFPWAAFFVIYTFNVIRKKTYSFNYTQLLLMLILALIFPPLVSFSIYFCIIHSPRHIFIILNEMNSHERLRAIKETIFYSLTAFLLMFTVGYFLASSYIITDSIIKVVFIGLAALTVPHMILIDYFESLEKE